VRESYTGFELRTTFKLIFFYSSDTFTEKSSLKKMADKKIKLSYFNFKARAELSRLILAQAGVDYEDFRIEMEDWPNHKASKFKEKCTIEH
jgi:hypothetical protein